MRQMLHKNGYFLAMLILLAVGTSCEQIENDRPSQNDSLAVIPVGPGTRPSATVPPDTPVSEQDSVIPPAVDVP